MNNNYWTDRTISSSLPYQDVNHHKRQLSRQKYDVLKEPEWFLERVQEAFGSLTFLNSRFDPAIDMILTSEQDQTVFIVPPFSVAAKFLELASHEAIRRPNSTILFLISARTEAFSWHDHLFGKAYVQFIRGPFRFVGLDKGLSAAFIIYGKCSEENLEKIGDLGTIITPMGIKTPA